MLTLAAEHDSVAAAFEVSYRHLAPGLQEFFRRLGLHPGTTIDGYAAAALAGISLPGAAGQLDALHGEGLLTEAGHRRYGMHDLIRRYARDLAATDPAGSREQALERLLDYYQFTAALAESLVARRNSHHSRPGPAGIYLGTVRRLTGDYRGAAEALQEALSIYRDTGNRTGLVSALNNLGRLRRLTGDHHGAAEALQEALSTARDIGNRGGETEALDETGMLHLARGDSGQAAQYHRQALDLARDITSPRDEARALAGLGRCALADGRTADGIEGLRQAREIFQQIGAAEAAGIAAELDSLAQPGTTA